MQIVSREGGGVRERVCVFVCLRGGSRLSQLKGTWSSIKDWAMIVLQTTQMNVRGNPHQSLDSRALTSTCTHAHMHARAHTFRPASNMNHLSCSGIFLGEPKGTSVGYHAMFSSLHTHTRTSFQCQSHTQICVQTYFRKHAKNTVHHTSWNLTKTQRHSQHIHEIWCEHKKKIRITYAAIVTYNYVISAPNKLPTSSLPEASWKNSWKSV